MLCFLFLFKIHEIIMLSCLRLLFCVFIGSEINHFCLGWHFCISTQMCFESAAAFGENKLIRPDLAYTPFLSLLFSPPLRLLFFLFLVPVVFSVHFIPVSQINCPKKIQIFPIKELLEKFGNPFPKIEVDKSNLSHFKQKVFLFCSTCIEKHCFCFYYHICITVTSQTTFILPFTFYYQV